jgi:hypothetical protein
VHTGVPIGDVFFQLDTLHTMHTAIWGDGEHPPTAYETGTVLELRFDEVVSLHRAYATSLSRRVHALRRAKKASKNIAQTLKVCVCVCVFFFSK